MICGTGLIAHSSGLVTTWTTGPNSMALMRKSAAEVALNLQNHDVMEGVIEYILREEEERRRGGESRGG